MPREDERRGQALKYVIVELPFSELCKREVFNQESALSHVLVYAASHEFKMNYACYKEGYYFKPKRGKFKMADQAELSLVSGVPKL